MPALTTIVVADNTPTNHNFAPLRRVDDMLYLVNRESVTQAGNMSIGLRLDLASGKRLTNRVQYRFAHPFEVTIDGVTTVRDIARANTDFILPVGMTDAERLRFVTMYNNSLAIAGVKGYVSVLDPYFS